MPTISLINHESYVDKTNDSSLFHKLNHPVIFRCQNVLIDIPDSQYQKLANNLNIKVFCPKCHQPVRVNI